MSMTLKLKTRKAVLDIERRKVIEQFATTSHWPVFLLEFISGVLIYVILKMTFGLPYAELFMLCVFAFVLNMNIDLAKECLVHKMKENLNEEEKDNPTSKEVEQSQDRSEDSAKSEEPEET